MFAVGGMVSCVGPKKMVASWLQPAGGMILATPPPPKKKKGFSAKPWKQVAQESEPKSALEPCPKPQTLNPTLKPNRAGGKGVTKKKNYPKSATTTPQALRPRPLNPRLCVPPAQMGSLLRCQKPSPFEGRKGGTWSFGGGKH